MVDPEFECLSSMDTRDHRRRYEYVETDPSPCGEERDGDAIDGEDAPCDISVHALYIMKNRYNCKEKCRSSPVIPPVPVILRHEAIQVPRVQGSLLFGKK